MTLAPKIVGIEPPLASIPAAMPPSPAFDEIGLNLASTRLPRDARDGHLAGYTAKTYDALRIFQDSVSERRLQGPALADPEKLHSLIARLPQQELRNLEHLDIVQEYPHLISKFDTKRFDELAAQICRNEPVAFRTLVQISAGSLPAFLNRLRYTQLVQSNLGSNPENPLSGHLAQHLERLPEGEAALTKALIQELLGRNFNQEQWRTLIDRGHANPLFFHRTYRSDPLEALSPAQRAAVLVPHYYGEELALEAIEMAEQLAQHPERLRVEPLDDEDALVRHIAQRFLDEPRFLEQYSQAQEQLEGPLSVDCEGRRFTIERRGDGFLVVENGRTHYFSADEKGGAIFDQAFAQIAETLQWTVNFGLEERDKDLKLWYAAAQRNMQGLLGAAAIEALRIKELQSLRPRVRSEDRIDRLALAI